MIIHNATVHSPVERFATAMHVEDGVITWLGDEDTAAFRSLAFPAARRIDAKGALITPSFVDAWAGGASPAELLSRGVTAVIAEGSLERFTSAGLDAAPLPGGPGAQAVVTISTDAEFEEFTDRAPKAAHDRPAGRMHLDARYPVPVALLRGREVVVSIDSGVGLALADLAREGIPFALRGERAPWETIAAAMFEGPGPLSARAAFTAHTRGAWRLTPGQTHPRGVLRVGAPADFAVWEVQALAVQAPDAAVSQWSTDERAGTPLLPALGSGEDPPVLQELYRAGQRL